MRYLIHFVIPTLILSFGFGLYVVLSSYLPKPENDIKFLEMLVELQKKKPEKSAEFGVPFQIEATKQKIAADLQFKTGLKKIIFGGTLILVIVSAIRENSIYTKTKSGI